MKMIRKCAWAKQNHFEGKHMKNTLAIVQKRYLAQNKIHMRTITKIQKQQARHNDNQYPGKKKEYINHHRPKGNYNSLVKP